MEKGKRQGSFLHGILTKAVAAGDVNCINDGGARLQYSYLGTITRVAELHSGR